MGKNKLNQSEKKELIAVLEERFEKNMQRHKDITWDEVKARLEDDESKLSIIWRMENTGGEPDAIGYDSETRQIVYCDCVKESPEGRRSFCYDKAALESRKQAKPVNNVIDAAKEIGIDVLDEDQYKELQKLGEFDLKTQSWIKTSEDIRKLGGAIFGDRRYGRVFIYHNGADSYYGVRGFRGLVKV